LIGISDGDSNGNQVGSAEAPRNPLLDVLADNGGPTMTHFLMDFSPAIDAGNNGKATGAGLTTDQRGTGFPRIVHGTVDIGSSKNLLRRAAKRRHWRDQIR